jgi:hypothetical protein
MSAVERSFSINWKSFREHLKRFPARYGVAALALGGSFGVPTLSALESANTYPSTLTWLTYIEGNVVNCPDLYYNLGVSFPGSLQWPSSDFADSYAHAGTYTMPGATPPDLTATVAGDSLSLTSSANIVIDYVVVKGGANPTTGQGPGYNVYAGPAQSVNQGGFVAANGFSHWFVCFHNYTPPVTTTSTSTTSSTTSSTTTTAPTTSSTGASTTSGVTTTSGATTTTTAPVTTTTGASTTTAPVTTTTGASTTTSIPGGTTSTTLIGPTTSFPAGPPTSVPEVSTSIPSGPSHVGAGGSSVTPVRVGVLALSILFTLAGLYGVGFGLIRRRW